MTKRRTSLALLLPILLLACSGNSDNSALNTPPDTNLTATLADTGETHLLRDDMKPLDTVMMLEAVGNSDLIVVDSQPSIGYFEDHLMTRTYGRRGRGPCEFLEISNVDTNGDSLYVLDSAQAKIISYQLSSGACLGEISHPKLQRAHYLERVSEAFLTGRIFYRVGTPDSTVLLSLVHDNGTVEDLPLTKREVNPVPVIFPLDPQGIDFARYSNRIYATFPMSGILAKLDLETHEISTYSMDLVLNREAFEDAVSGPGDAGDLINGGMVEIVRGVFAAKNWVGVSTVRPDMKGPTFETFYLFTPEGKLIHELELQDNPVTLRGNELLFIDATDSTETQYGYQVTYRQVTID